jgi:hypothetical protein
LGINTSKSIKPFHYQSDISTGGVQISTGGKSFYFTNQHAFFFEDKMAIWNVAKGNVKFGGVTFPDQQAIMIQSDAGTFQFLSTGYFRPNMGLLVNTGVGDWTIQGDGNQSLIFRYNNATRGYFRSTGPDTAVNFTGVHRCYLQKTRSCSDVSGLIVCAKDDDYVLMSGGFVRGVEAVTIDECLPIVSICESPRDKRVFGVASKIEGDAREDTFGSFSTSIEKQLGDTRVHVNSVGEGAIWVCDSEGEVSSGDYITSSVVPGYGCNQRSDTMLSCTVAKLTMSCNFDGSYRPKLVQKKEYVLKNVIKKVEVVKKQVGEIRFVDGKYIREVGEVTVMEDMKRMQTVYDQHGNSLGEMEVDVYEEIQVEQNVIDANGDAVWIPELDKEGNVVMEPMYRMRWLLHDGTQISQTEYLERIGAGEVAYRAAFLGATYHCG